MGFNAMLRERQLQREISKSEPYTPVGMNAGFWLSLLIWAGFFGTIIWSFYTSQPTGTRIFSAIGLIWSGLWTRYLALDHGQPRLAEFSLLTSLIGFLALTITATIQMGYPLSFPAGLLLFIGTALLVSLINNSITALTCAVAGILFWAALQIDGFLESGAFTMAIPAVLAISILQAIRLKSGLTVLVVAVMGYLWLASASFLAFNNGELSALYLAVGAVIVGCAHLRAAKAAEDEGMDFTQWQIAFGWMIANGALLVLAKYGMDPADPIWQASSVTIPSMRLAWLGIIGVAGLVYIAGSLIRVRHRRMSLAGTCLTTLLLFGLALGVWNIAQTEQYFSAFAKVPLYPFAGLVLFGIVTGNILFFVANAFRRFHYGKVIVGLLGVMALAYAASDIDLTYQENWVYWMLGAMASMMLSLLAVEPQLKNDTDPDLRTSVSSS